MVSIDLTSSHFQYLHKQCTFSENTALTAWLTSPALRASAFHMQSLRPDPGVTSSPRCWVVNGNKEAADDWTGRQELGFLYVSETTSWQSMLIFMEEFFQINGQPLCSLSEVFLIIPTLFSAHVPLFEKFIKPFSPHFLLVLGFAHWDSPQDVCINFQRLPERSPEAPPPPSRARQSERQHGGHHRASVETFITGRNSPYIYVRLQQGVDAIDDPAEQAPVQGLGHGVSDVGGFVHSVGADDGLSPGDHALGGQGLLELLWADAEQRRRWGETRDRPDHPRNSLRLLQTYLNLDFLPFVKKVLWKLF